MEREEMFQLILLFAFQRKNPDLQREMGNLPARRDAPSFESRLGVLPGSSLVAPARPALAGGLAQGWLPQEGLQGERRKAMLVPGQRGQDGRAAR